MDAKMKAQLIETATDEIAGLLRDHIDGVSKGLSDGMISHEKESPFKYNVSLGLTIKPVGNACNVTAKISYGVRHSDTSIGQTIDPNQMKMPLDT